MVNQAVDRIYFRPDRSTVRSTGPCGFGRARLPVDRAVDRQTLQSTDRLTDCMTLTLEFCRSTGPVDRQFNILFLKIAGGRPGGRPEPTALLPSDLPVDRQLSRLPQRLYFESVLFSSVSNGYFLFLSGLTHP